MSCFYLSILYNLCFAQKAAEGWHRIFNLVSHLEYTKYQKRRRPYYADEYSMAVVRTLQAGLAVSLHLRLVRPCPCFPMFPKLASPLCRCLRTLLEAVSGSSNVVVSSCGPKRNHQVPWQICRGSTAGVGSSRLECDGSPGCLHAIQLAHPCGLGLGTCTLTP